MVEKNLLMTRALIVNHKYLICNWSIYKLLIINISKLSNSKVIFLLKSN